MFAMLLEICTCNSQSCCDCFQFPIEICDSKDLIKMKIYKSQILRWKRHPHKPIPSTLSWTTNNPKAVEILQEALNSASIDMLCWELVKLS